MFDSGVILLGEASCLSRLEIRGIKKWGGIREVKINRRRYKITAPWSRKMAWQAIEI